MSGSGSVTIITNGDCKLSSAASAVFISTDNTFITFEVADRVSIKGKTAGVLGARGGSNRNVTFKSASGALASVSVEGETYCLCQVGVTLQGVLMRCSAPLGCFSECPTITFTDCNITDSTGAAVVGHTVKLANGDVVTNLLIEPDRYSIRIAGNYITPANRANITGEGIVGGTISFDPETRTLLLDNAQVKRANYWAIIVEMNDLTIALRGHSKLESSNGTSIPLRIDGRTTITAAEGELNPIIEATNGGKAGGMAYAAVWCSATTIISNCELRAYGASGIQGGRDSIVLDNATLRAASLGTPTSQAERRAMLSMFNIGKLVLRGSNFTAPAQVWYNDGSPTYEGQTYPGFAITGNASAPTRDTVVIEPCYPVMVGGHFVRKAEADNIRHGVTAGTASYNPATKTLSLNGATIVGGKGIGSRAAALLDMGVSGLDDTLRIALKGQNNINGTGSNITNYAILGQNVEIEGTVDDWLYADNGMVMSSNDLTLRGCNVVVDNALNGAITVNSGVLKMDDAYLKVRGKDYSLKCKQRDLSINSDSTVYIGLTSHSAEFDTDGYLVRTGTTDRIAGEWVVLEPCYGIKVNGVHVCRSNYDDLRVIEGVTGGASFSPAERVLRLNNARLSQLLFELGGVRVSVEGNNTIAATGPCAIGTNIDGGDYKVTIEAMHGATLNIEATAAGAKHGIESADKDTLIIKNLNLNILCDKQAAIGGKGVFIVQNTSAEFTGTTASGTIFGPRDFVLRCAEISAPYRATFDVSQKAVVTVANAIVKQGLTIVPFGSTGDTSVVATGSFTWHGTTYTASGNYVQTFTSSSGCDSVVTLHLTITVPPTYTIEATSEPSNGGSISGAGDYDEGATATLTATPAVGYKFVRWTAGGKELSTNATLNIMVSSDSSLVAVFEAIINVYTITATSEPANGGSISGAGDYDEGATAKLTATPAAGYKFVRWTAGGKELSTNATLNITVSSDSSLVAVFEAATPCTPYNEEFSATASSSYEWNGKVYTASGDYVQTFTATNGCDSTVTLHLTIASNGTTGLRGSRFETLSIYPNPTTTGIYVDSHATEVRVYSMGGLLLLR